MANYIPVGAVVPRPFLKWAGGKGGLLEELRARFEEAQAPGRYHEPFVGGGAFFFDLFRRGLPGNARPFLSDANARLIAAYAGVRDAVEDVIALLETHKSHHNSEYYYAVRATIPEALAEQAARIIYLNRTCFNGLYRENSRGGFNVPIGKYKNPAICDAENLRAVSSALAQAEVACRPFETVLDRAQAGDFVYFDPPYHPLSASSSFTKYHETDFGEDAQRALAAVFRELDRKGVRVLLSNSMCPFVRELYQEFRIDTVYANRSVNSKADARGKIEEALVRNF